MEMIFMDKIQTNEELFGNYYTNPPKSKGITDKLNEIVQHIIKFAKTGMLEIDETSDMI